MISNLFFHTLYQPLYNGLIFLIDIIPGADAGVAVIILTVVVKLILFPLSIQSVKTQIKMKEIQPELDAINKKYKDNTQERGLQTLALYRKNKVRPFLGILLLFIQLPIVIALYRIFYAGGFPAVNQTILYSFVTFPALVDVFFLGIDISTRGLLLPIVVAITQFIQAQIIVIAATPSESASQFQKDLTRSLHVQVKYIFPIFMFILAYSVPSVVSLYLITSNVFAIGQELYIRRRYRNKTPKTPAVTPVLAPVAVA